MKIRKRSVSLLLAFVMMFSIFSSGITAYAAEDHSNSVSTEDVASDSEAYDPAVAAENEPTETTDFSEADADETMSDTEITSTPSEPVSTEEPTESGEQTMETHSLQWISGSTSTVIEGSKLTITPDKNGYNTSSVTAQLNFSFGGERNMPAGAITIRLPRHIFYDREGSPVGTVEIPLAKAPLLRV